MTTTETMIPASPAFSSDPPPDLETAQRWYDEVTAAIEATEADQAALKARRARLPYLEAERRRSHLIDRRQLLATRQRELRQTIERQTGRTPIRSLVTRMHARDREIRVDAMHAATRRFALLEELFCRVEALLGENDAHQLELCLSDISKDRLTAIVEQVEVIQNHGAG